LGDDPLFDEVARFVVKNRKASTSVLQRRFRIGYGRAARLMDILEEEGIIGQSIGSRPRDVLVPPDYFDSVSETQNPDA
jgi:S-DNA-T family DNA segregation ATPase FtsK/SpoIIIE